MRVQGETTKRGLNKFSVNMNSLYEDGDATLDDLREAVETLEETERTARRVLGGAHPFTVEVERNLGDVRAALRARETPPRNA